LEPHNWPGRLHGRACGGATAYPVLNATSAPSLVPAAFVAVIRKWYSVFATRPAAIDAETATGLEPEPGRVAIDYLYVANWSLWKDVKILLRTVPHVLGRRGL